MPKDVVCNGLLYAVTDPVSASCEGKSPEEDRETVLTYARAIRASIEEMRDPQFVHDAFALCAEEWFTAASANHVHFVPRNAGQLIINSGYR